MMLFSFISSFLAIKDAERVDYDAGVTQISVELDPQQQQAQPKPAVKDNVKAVQVEQPPNPAEAVKLPQGEERQSEAKTETPAKDPVAEANEQKKQEEQKKKKTPETLGITGEMSKSVQGKMNVTMTVWFSAMRDFPQSDALRPIVTCGLLGNTMQKAGIDPMRDLDGAMFSGQQLQDPAKFTAALQHRMQPQQVHDPSTR
jgi:hypothetical protein